jgi:uncharacterized protein with HEPN domain
MSRDPRLRLEDVIDACDRIESHIAGLTSDLFEIDRKTQDAVIRVFEIIGEAVKSIPEEIRQLEPDIPWRQIAGFRDVLAHSYFAVDPSIVWSAATRKTPDLRPACQRILSNYSS